MDKVKLVIIGLILLILDTNIFAKEIPFTTEDRDRLIRLEVKIEEMNKRFEQRFEQIEKRIEDSKAIMLSGFTILFAGMFCMIGFVIWDRRTAISPLATRVKQIDERTEIQGIEIGKIGRLISALRELSNVDSRVKDVLVKFNLL